MLVVQIGRVRVGLSNWHMHVRVAVGTMRHGIVRMIMVTIVMRMRVLVLQGFVLMLVLMPFGQVGPNAESHEASGACHQPRT